MKYTVTIEETVVKDFEVEAESMERAIDAAIINYKSGEFVLDPGEVIHKQIRAFYHSQKDSGWREF
ncbi:MAG: hypothetical protein HPZ82_07590 [Coprobacter sp.]|nr:hypothetical protein [Coprobacter sp.]